MRRTTDALLGRAPGCRTPGPLHVALGILPYAAALGLIAALTFGPARAQDNPAAAAAPDVDTALILAVDVSESVDEDRFRLQMEGIARALEDTGVISTITSGAKGAIAVALLEWADSAEVTIDWQIIRSVDDAARCASAVRERPHRRGEYTCLSRMMTIVREKILESAPTALRTVLDVSGDGIDNCADASADDAARDELAAQGVTINGLPIIVAGQNDVVGSGAYRAPGYGLRELPRGPATGTTTLDAWFREHVIGGPAAFLITAQGYADFGRAFRQKFVTEISLRE